MLSQPHRLPANARLTKARFFKSSIFSVKYAPNNLPASRFGFVIRKTVDRRAVARNRIKRVFRSCIEQQYVELKTGYDMLFFLEKGIMDKKQQELCQLLHSHWEQLKLLK